jgi:hypothetical protein
VLELKNLLSNLGPPIFVAGLLCYVIVSWVFVLTVKTREVSAELWMLVSLCLLVMGIGFKIFSM